jgi:hypothetical protein
MGHEIHTTSVDSVTADMAHVPGAPGRSLSGSEAELLHLVTVSVALHHDVDQQVCGECSTLTSCHSSADDVSVIT